MWARPGWPSMLQPESSLSSIACATLRPSSEKSAAARTSGHRLRARAQAETREDEVAGVGTAGTVRGQRRIGQRLEAQGG